MIKVMITGHRSVIGEINFSDWVGNRLLELKEEHDSVIAISGVAIGADTIFADKALDLDIPLTCAVPFEYQPGWTRVEGIPTQLTEKAWPRAAFIYWTHSLLGKASRVVFVDTVEGYKLRNVEERIYHPAKFQRRNEWMVDNADICLAYYKQIPGGTANCLKYANAEGLPVIYYEAALPPHSSLKENEAENKD